ncbi:MAG: NINE protein [Clostridia bacterium]
MDTNKDTLTEVENNENAPIKLETTEEKVVEPTTEETPVFDYSYSTNAVINSDKHTCEHQHQNGHHMPPHGRPHHCHRHNGQPPHQGRPPMGQMPYGQPPHGQPPHGQPPHGQPPHGQPPHGQPPHGQAPYGQPPQWQAPYGQPPQWQAPYGQPPQGQAPYGQAVPTPGQNPYPQNQQPLSFNMYSQKSRFVAGILGVLLGGFGIHNFYLGFTTKGVIQIILTLLTLGLGSVWGFIEGILYLSGAMDKDVNGIPLKD